MDLAGPYAECLPVTETCCKPLWPKYMLVAAFVPFREKEAQARQAQEINDRRAAGLTGPVNSERTTKPSGQTLYFVEVLPSKQLADTLQAMKRIVNLHSLIR